MKTLELEKIGVIELQLEQSNKVVGGALPWAAFWLGVGIGVGAMAVYDFANGVYSGINEELAKS